MAQKVQVFLVCDLHEGEVEGDETLSFSLDGTAYEMDVCEEHAAEVRDAFAPYVGAARRANRAVSASRAPARKGARAQSYTDKIRVTAMRDWGRENGFEVSERGRLSKAVISAYEAAH